MDGRIQIFAEFWPFYLGEHAKPATRALHVVGSTVALIAVIVAIVRRLPMLLAVALVAGYALAWIAHAAIEHNRPATFRHPLWSFLADWKMWGCAITGQLDGELERAGVKKGP
jgi:hypothetical protein